MYVCVWVYVFVNRAVSFQKHSKWPEGDSTAVHIVI